MALNINNKSVVWEHRERIIKSASLCIRKKGICGSSVHDIAAHAQLSVGQVYRCFESKMKIAQETLKDNMDKQIQLLIEIYSQSNPIDYVIAKNIIKNNAHEQLVYDLKVIFRTESMYYPELESLLLEQEVRLMKKHSSLVRSAAFFQKYESELIFKIIDSLITETTISRNLNRNNYENISFIYKELTSIKL